MLSLKVYKTHPNVVIPKFATQQSACFDLSLQGSGKSYYRGFSRTNAPIERPYRGTLTVMPGDRIMAPTGLIFDIPAGYSVRVHPRSGLSLKQGLILANLEGVIDSDYINETLVLLTNVSDNPIVIKDGERIAQAELIRQETYTIEVTEERPVTKTDRVGGFGSTGVKTMDISNLNIVAQTEKRGRGRPKKVAI